MAHQTLIRATSGTVKLDGSASPITCQLIERRQSAKKKTRTHVVRLSNHPAAFEVAATNKNSEDCSNWPDKKVVFKASTKADGSWAIIKCRENPKKKTTDTRLKNGHMRLRKSQLGLHFVRGSLRITVIK